MVEPVPPHYLPPKTALFSSVEDPESHLAAFMAQMIISGGSDAIRCKILMGTFTGTTLQWFSGILDRSFRVNETSVEKRMDSRYIPYIAKRDEPKTKTREGSATKPKFRVSYKELLSMHGVADKLKFPQKIDWFLGSQRDAWREFHRAFRQNVERCIALGFQLATLVKERFLKEYLEANQEEPKGEVVIKDQTHETPIHGDLNTIARGFFGGGSSASKRK